jgi:hypothetical protein
MATPMTTTSACRSSSFSAGPQASTGDTGAPEIYQRTCLDGRTADCPAIQVRRTETRAARQIRASQRQQGQGAQERGMRRHRDAYSCSWEPFMGTPPNRRPEGRAVGRHIIALAQRPVRRPRLGGGQRLRAGLGHGTRLRRHCLRAGAGAGARSGRPGSRPGQGPATQR